MKKIYWISVLCCLLGLLLFTAGCGNIVEPDRFTNINDGVRSLSYLTQPDPHDAIIDGPIAAGDPEYPDRPPNLAGYNNTVYRYDVARGYNEGICLDPGSDVLWPGALIDANTVRAGDYRPIPVARGPLTLSITVAGVSLSALTIPEAGRDAVCQSISTLAGREATGTDPASVFFSAAQVYSEDQLRLSLGTYACGLNNDFKSMFEFSNDTIRTRVLVTYRQQYYTIDVNHPAKPGDFLADSVSWKEFRDKAGSNTCPVYVSQVTYGRMAVISIKSSYSASDVTEAARFAYDGIANGGAEWETHCHEVLDNSTIEARIFGGNAATATSVAINGFAGLQAWVKTDGNLKTVPVGAPLSYKLRYLGDNSITNVVLASRYYVRDTARIHHKFRVTFIELENMGGERTQFNGNILIYTGYEGQNDDTNGLAISYNTPNLSSRHTYTLQKSIEYNFDENNLENAYIIIEQQGIALPDDLPGFIYDFLKVKYLFTTHRKIMIADVLQKIEQNGIAGDDATGQYYLSLYHDGDTIEKAISDYCGLSYNMPDTISRLHFTFEPID